MANYATKPKAIVTLAVGSHLQLLELSRSSLETYAMRHGYDLIIKTELTDLSRPPAWSKISAIREALTTHEFVFWLDSDTLILRFDHDVVSDLDDDADFAWVNHGAEYGPNAGVMVFRRTPAAFHFLDDIDVQSDLVNHPLWEQAAMMRILGILHPLFLLLETSCHRASRYNGLILNGISSGKYHAVSPSLGIMQGSICSYGRFQCQNTYYPIHLLLAELLVT